MLSDVLVPHLESHRGYAACGVEHLSSGEAFWFRADEPMPTASLIKIAVLIEAYRQAEAGRLTLQSLEEWTETDRVPGAGILTPHCTPGLRLSLRDACRLMIAFSDNSATNLVLRKIGLEAPTETMRQLGFNETRVHAFVYRRETSLAPERSERFGVGSTTAREMTTLLARLRRAELADPAHTAEMLEHLRACQHRTAFPRQLPAEAIVAFKTGYFEGIRTAAGIIESPSGPIVITVLTRDNENQSREPDSPAEILTAHLVRLTWDWFSADSTTPRNTDA